MNKLVRNLNRHTSAPDVMKSCVHKGKYQQTLDIYDKITQKEKNDYCDLLALKACIRIGNFAKGKEIHKQIECYLHENEYLQSTLIYFYGENADIYNALNIFNNIDESKRDIVIITSMMKAYNNCLMYKEALDLYNQSYSDIFNIHIKNKKNKKKPIAHLLALKACTNMNDYEKGKEIHSNLNKLNITNNNYHIATELINFYGKCHDIDNAINVFNSNLNNSKSVICIASMLTAYNNNKQYTQTIELYEISISYVKSLQWHDTSLLQTLKACINTKNIQKGKEIAYLISKIMNRNNVNTLQVKTALIRFYGSTYICDVERAENIYHSINTVKKDIFVVNVLMEAYCNNNLYNKCLELYKDINCNTININDNIRIQPDLLTYINVLKACTHETSYYFGKLIHDKLKQDLFGRYILKHKEIQIELINFYAKCGIMDKCDEIFSDIFNYEFDKFVSEIGIWNAMIHGYGRNFDLEKVKNIYDRMINEVGMQPDCQTYVVLIKAYSNCGNIEYVKRIWKYEIMDDNIKYNEYVMTVLIDCMAKKGLLNESKQLIIDYHSNCKVMWMSLLSAAHQYNKIDFVDTVYHEMEDRFKDDIQYLTTASVLISNAYASTSDFNVENVFLNK